MSLIKANGVQIGQSLTATNNFVWYQPAVPDGTIRLANGNSGSATDILTINSSGNATFVGSVVAYGTTTSAADLKLYEDTDNGSNYVALKAPASITSNVTFILPSVDGSSGQALKTDGSGNLSFGPVDALPSQTGNDGKFLTTNGSTASWAAAGVSATDDTSTNATYYPSLFTATSGSITSAKVSSTKLYFNPSTGVLYATTFQSSSDVSKKTNVVTAASDVVDQLRGVEFDWVDGSGTSAGVIAQELEAVLPNLVSANEDGTKNVNYDGIIAYLIENVKQLNAKVRDLESK